MDKFHSNSVGEVHSNSNMLNRRSKGLLCQSKLFRRIITCLQIIVAVALLVVSIGTMSGLIASAFSELYSLLITLVLLVFIGFGRMEANPEMMDKTSKALLCRSMLFRRIITCLQIIVAVALVVVSVGTMSGLITSASSELKSLVMVLVLLVMIGLNSATRGHPSQ